MLFVLAAATAHAGEPPLTGVFADNFVLLEETGTPPGSPFVVVGRDDGRERPARLADYRGRVLLVNFWATWCAPCVREMPALDRLQAKLGAAGLSVLPLSSDRTGVVAVAPFYAELGLDTLGLYLDPNGRLANEAGVRGLPTTLLIDRAGRLVGGLEGPVEWDGPEAEALIRHYLDKAEAPATTGG